MSPPFQEREGAGHAPPLTPHLCALPAPFSNPAVFEKKVLRIVKGYGHSLSLSKTAYRGAGDVKIVTGVAITKDEISTIPNKLRHKIVEGTGQSCAGDASAAASTLGRISSARMIEPHAFPEAERQVLLSMEDQP